MSLKIFLSSWKSFAYDEEISDAGSVEYAKVKPRKVIEAMKVFSDPRFNIDVLKVEVPVNVKSMLKVLLMVKWFTVKLKLLTSLKHKKQRLTFHPHLPKCRCVSKLFQETLQFAHDSGAKFNGVLCGRVLGQVPIEPYIKDGKHQHVNGCVQLIRKILTNLIKFLLKQLVHGLIKYSKNTTRRI